MTKVPIIHQLATLIEDAESHRNSDGTLDDVFQNDVGALRFAVVEIKRIVVKEFCYSYEKCGTCSLNEKGLACDRLLFADEKELDVILKAIEAVE